MNKLMGVAAAALTLLAGMPAQAVPIVFFTPLSGAAEEPPAASPAFGSADITLDTALHTMLIRATFSGLLGPTTAAHIHCCTLVPGVGNVGVATQVPRFSGFPVGVLEGSFSQLFNTADAGSWNAGFIGANGGTALGAEAALLAGLQSGRAYFNIHTTAFPGGEIRGFLAVPEPSSIALALLALGVVGVGARRRRD